MRFIKPRKYRPAKCGETVTCDRCGADVEVSNPLAAGSPDSEDTSRIVGECHACGNVINEEREPFEDCDLD